MRFTIFVFVFVTILVIQIGGHSYLTQPIDRTDQAYSETGCRVDNPNTYGVSTGCPGPCDDSGGAEVTQTTPYNVERGQVLDIRWPRNNHPGGFVRFAWAPSTATTNAQFDSYSYRFECFEKGPLCEPSSPTNTGDATTDTQTGCGTNITVPAWVTDGLWTLQWAWFGGYSELGDYYSCANYQVSGGTTVNTADATYGAPGAAVFAGGDYANPNQQQCQFRNTDRLHQCVQENCNAPLYTLGVEQTGVPVNTDGSSLRAVSSIYPTVNAPTPVTLPASSKSKVPCSKDSDCKSGVCEASGYCYVPSSGLGAGGAAALFFAFLFLAVVIAAVLFAYINKSEWRNWRPFNVIFSKA